MIQEAWVGGVTTRWRHNRAILAIGGFTLVGDPGADGGPGLRSSGIGGLASGRCDGAPGNFARIPRSNLILGDNG